MADEATDALIPDEAPSTEAAPTEAPAPDPFEKRYNDLRPQYDKVNTLIDRARQGDPEAFRELNLPVQFEEDPGDPTPEEYEDPYAPKLAEYEQKIAALEAKEQQREAERVASGIRSHVDSLAQQEGIELTDYDREVIFRGAVGGDAINEDQTAAAFKAHADYLNSLRESIAPRGSAPRPGTGQAVEKQPDLDNQDERREWMKAQLGF